MSVRAGVVFDSVRVVDERYVSLGCVMIGRMVVVMF